MPPRASPDSHDEALRAAAFAALRAMSPDGAPISWATLSQGFWVGGQHHLLANKARGIFKPKDMGRLLSIKTVHPRAGRTAWYEDQSAPCLDAIKGQDSLSYAFQGTDPDSHDNRLLLQAQRERFPIIYLLGIAPGIYQPLFPAYIEEWDAKHLRAGISVLPNPNDTLAVQPLDPSCQDAAIRRYGMALTKRRLHQARFRLAVMEAYQGRCALSALPEPRLLEAAHIVEDGDTALGQPVVSNGLLLSRLHHGAFDAGLLGVDADLRVHIAPHLRQQQGGALLRGLQELHGTRIHLPRRPADHPDRDRLAHRFARFQHGS